MATPTSNEHWNKSMLRSLKLSPNWVLEKGRTLTQKIDQNNWTEPQMRFWSDIHSQQRLFCGGVGAGKTYAGCVEVVNQAPGTLGIIAAPTYVMLKDSTLRTFLELYENSGIIRSFNKSDMTMTLKGDRTILWRSADKPDKIRGISAAWAWLDEAAYCDEDAYNVILGRLRRVPGRLWMTTTPNGKGNWVYRLVQRRQVSVTYASTKTNRFIPDFYVNSLLDTYDEQRAAQEVEGLFVDLDGTLFKSSWFKEWNGEIPEKLILCRAWDSAATEGGGDYTCGLLMGMIPGTDKMIILDRVYGQYGADKVDAMIRTAADSDGTKVTVVLEQEPGSAGKRLLSQQVKALAGHRVCWYSPGAKKLARAVPVARAAAQGRIYYVKADWNEEFFTEIDSFTGTTADSHDDQVDSLSMGFSHLEGNVKRVQVI